MKEILLTTKGSMRDYALVCKGFRDGLLRADTKNFLANIACSNPLQSRTWCQVGKSAEPGVGDIEAATFLETGMQQVLGVVAYLP
jgi:hypothetical protein